MKILETIKALREGKRVERMPSDPSVSLCDHLGTTEMNGYYQLCHQDKIIRVAPDVTCAGRVQNIMTLEQFQVMNSFMYVNFKEYETK